MSTKRSPKNRKARLRITPEAIEAFRAGDDARLHNALGLQAWQTSPLGAVGDCPWPPDCAGALSWPLAVELREMLEAASAE